MIVGAEKAVDIVLVIAEHVSVGIGGREVTGVVLPGRSEGCEGHFHGLSERHEGFVLGARDIGRIAVTGELWSLYSCERRAHEDDGAKELWVSGDAMAGNGGSEIVANEHGDGVMPEGFDKGADVLCDVEEVVRCDWVVKLDLFGCVAGLRDGAPVPPQVGSNDMIASMGCCKRGKDLTPRTCELREAVQQEDQGK